MISLGHFEEFLDWVHRNGHSGNSIEPIHLNVNTGMNRLGVAREELPKLSKLINSVGGLKIGTVYTHLASTENPDNDTQTEAQFSAFMEMCGELRNGLRSELTGFKTHSLNSSGVVRFPSRMDYVRVGLILLGLSFLGLGLLLSRPFSSALLLLKSKPYLQAKAWAMVMRTLPIKKGKLRGCQ